jgi:hypothetical protein
LIQVREQKIIPEIWQQIDDDFNDASGYKFSSFERKCIEVDDETVFNAIQ